LHKFPSVRNNATNADSPEEDGAMKIILPNNNLSGEYTVLVQIDPDDSTTLDFTGISGAIGRMEADERGGELLCVEDVFDIAAVLLADVSEIPSSLLFFLQSLWISKAVSIEEASTHVPQLSSSPSFKTLCHKPNTSRSTALPMTFVVWSRREMLSNSSMLLPKGTCKAISKSKKRTSTITDSKSQCKMMIIKRRHNESVVQTAVLRRRRSERRGEP
jgi:hypothetical protein